ncbi:MAG: hypothetical protein CMJ18_02980 [Phycisphaeraceae bacterium]|nr:hypothetical protein [Phycisphaeraceae bacterium]
MIRQVNYNGVLIPESVVDGEGTADGMTPNYAQGMQVSRDRWLILFDTADRRGRDCWRAVFYQVRDGAPDGPVLNEKLLVARDRLAVSADGTELFRANGQPAVFGVPKGAFIDGRVPEHANVFAITWHGCAIQRRDGWSRGATDEDGWDASLLEPYHEIVHARLNEAEDDIEIIEPRRRMQPADGTVVPGHGWAQPIPDDAACTRWLDSFSGRPPPDPCSLIGAIAHEWDRRLGTYQWVRTGPFVEVRPKLQVSETNLVKLGADDYVLAARSFNKGGHTYWFRTADPFAGWGEYTEAPDTVGQRYAFRCADGQLRVFLNRQDMTPYGDRRNPLYCFDVSPDDFQYTHRRSVMDSRQLGLPLPEPFLDHVHLYEPVGNRQLMSVRTITCRQVWHGDDKVMPSDQEMDTAGIHYVEIVYDRDCPPRWRFDG